MKPDIVRTEKSVNRTRNKMLTGMLLHAVKSLRPVDLAFHASALSKWLIAYMMDDPFFDRNMQNACKVISFTDIFDNSRIAILSSLFGEESSLIQYNIKSIFSVVFCSLTANYRCNKFSHIGISVIEKSSHFLQSFHELLKF